ncbi:MAG: hypothetical protein QOK43_810 [Acidimicrobiaceae bacterium]|nr:hypothetical protein [Acidimicrobiaceae bacterium]
MPKHDEIARRIDEARRSADALEILEEALKQVQGALVKIEIEGTVIEVPRSAVVNMLRDLQDLSWGRVPTRAPAETEIGTQEAAVLLNVSRPYVVKLLDAGDIPFRKVGNRRRLLLADVIEYKSRDDEKRRQRLADLDANEDGSEEN